MKRFTNKNRFNKDELIKVIKRTIDCQIFYISGYDCMREYIENQENLMKMCDFMKLHEFNVIFICFNPKKKRYYIETVSPQEYVYVENKRENMYCVERFLKKTSKLDDVCECAVCFDGIRNDLSESIFNVLTYTCERCFNTVCITCYINWQDKMSYTCPFCKLSTCIDKSVEIISKGEKSLYVDRSKYNQVILKADTMAKNNLAEEDIKNFLSYKVL